MSAVRGGAHQSVRAALGGNNRSECCPLAADGFASWRSEAEAVATIRHASSRLGLLLLLR
jgi:hypothetical protein